MLLGHAWECIRWETNIGNFLLDPGGCGKLLSWLYNTSLHQLYTERLAEKLILSIDQSLGVFFIIAAISALLINPNRRLFRWPLYFATFSLSVVVFSLFYAKNFYLGILIENAAQLLTPLFLIAITNSKTNSLLFVFMKWAISLTFVGHGLFAIGYYPQPGYFIDMVIKGFGVSEPVAKNTLVLFGVLDFVFAISIFIPKFFNKALLYGIFWGFITALARITTSFSTDFLGNWVEQYLFEFMIRVPHFLLPMILWLNYRNRSIQTASR